MTSHTLCRVLGFTLLLCSPVGAAGAQDDPASIIARIEGVQTPNRQGLDGYTLQQLMQRFRVPGVSVAVIKDFQIHWAKSYGVADVETGRAVDEQTRFQAASISKPVAAMAAVRAELPWKLLAPVAAAPPSAPTLLPPERIEVLTTVPVLKRRNARATR